MKRQTVRIGVVLGLGLGLAWALLWSLGSGVRVAEAQGPDGYSIYYVDAGGACGGAAPCYSSVQAAVDAVDDPGDVVKVAAGTYGGVQGRPAPADYVIPPASGIISQVVYVSKTLTLQGGYTTADWTTPDPALNLTTLDAAGQGRVLFVAGNVSPTIAGFHLTGGDAAGLRGPAFGGSDCGGGIYLHRSAGTLRDNVIWGNVATDPTGAGGGLFLEQSDAVLRDNWIHHNSAYYGGGMFTEHSTATIENNRIWANVALDSSGGVHLFGGHSLMQHNEVYSNTAVVRAGGTYVDQNDSTLVGNRFYSNSAESGGGLFFLLHDGTLVNNVVVDNDASLAGSGVYVQSCSPTLVHTTIARNGGGDGSGVYVTNSAGPSSSPSLINTIVSDQLVGVRVLPGSIASLDSTLWYNNGAHWSGPVTRSNDRVGDPAFMDPGTGGYHLGPASAAIDGGVDAGVTVDADGEARPSGTGYDLGADERVGASRYNLDLRVAASSDDAEERGGGWTTVSGDSLTLGDFGGNLQTVGLRFDGLAITPGMHIASAYVQFESDASWSGPAQQTIEGHADDDAPAFANGWNAITSRPRTAAAVSWPVPDWTVVGAQDLEQRTPDLSAVLQEIVDRPGWAPGNAVALIFGGIAGRRVAESYDGDPPAAPLLHVEFTSAPPPTCWAMVDGSPTVYNQVQAAVDAAVDGDVVKVAGYCTGVSARATMTQVVYISKTLSLRGGYTTTNWTVADPLANPTTLDAQRQGRVLTIGGAISPTVEGLRITGGLGAGPSGDDGGGVYISGAAVTFRNNQVFDNAASYSGGGVCAWHSDSTFSNNTIYSNTSPWGAGLTLNYGSSVLDDNAVFSNTASSSGGGLILYNNNATLNRNQVYANSDGLYVEQGDVILADNDISFNAGYGVRMSAYGQSTLTGNTISANRGSGVRLSNRHATLAGNTIVSNTAATGGGLWIGGYTTLTSINDVFAGNHASAGGSGIYADSSSPLHVLHATLARNAGSAGVYAVGGSTLGMTNTVLVSHTLGIYVESGATVQLEATLWGSGAWANETDWGGAGTLLTGTVNVWGDPDFVAPDAWDYHIGAASAARDAGIEAGVHQDVDGQYRPMGWGVDIGVDELPGASLQLTKRASTLYPASGEVLSYTVVITSVGVENATGVVLTDTLDGWQRPLSAVSSLGSCAIADGGWGGAAVCTPSTIVTGASVAVTITAEVSPSISQWHTMTNTVVVVADDTANSAQLTLYGQGVGCAARINQDPTEYTSVQAAVDAAATGDTIKVAGTCLGARKRGALAQQIYLDKELTIRGGYAVGNWTTPDPVASPTTLDALGLGRVVYITGGISPTLEGLRITGGDAGGLGGISSLAVDLGGGVLVISATPTISSNWVFGNVASYGGGLYLYNSTGTLSDNTISSNSGTWGGGLALGQSDLSLTGNLVVSNTASAGGGLYLSGGQAAFYSNTLSFNTAAARGGGVWLDGVDAMLVGNTVFSNSVHSSGDAMGGGIYAGYGSTVTLGSNLIASNAAIGWQGIGGGVHLDNGSATLDGNVVSSNLAGGNSGIGGGLYLRSTPATLRGNVIASNTAGDGGGVRLQSSDSRLINNVIADNQGSSGLSVFSSSLDVLHNTFARNGTGVAVVGNPCTVAMTNTVLVSHTVGIYTESSVTVTLEATLWGSGAWANGTDWTGAGTILTGTVNLWDDPVFVDPDGGDYHVGIGSAAVEAGVDAGVTTDIDGENRPSADAYDIGADEFPLTGTRTVAPGDAPPVDFGVLGVTIDCTSGPGGEVHVTRHLLDYHSPPSGVGTMNGYWDVVADFSPYVCDLVLHYDEADLNGAAEGDIAGAARWDWGGHLIWRYLGGTLDTGANTITIPDIPDFSSWLILTSTPPEAVTDLGGTRAGSDLQIDWPAVTLDIQGNPLTPSHYVVYRRANEAHFLPTPADVIATPATNVYTDTGVLGDPAVNYYYMVTAVDGAGGESAGTRRLGAFNFQLVPAAGAGERAYNLIALPLEMPTVVDADTLAAYSGPGVYMVLQHDAATQGIEWRLPGLAGVNFSAGLGSVPYLYLDDTAATGLSLIGIVSPSGALGYSLERPAPGGSCTYNFISVPLHRVDLADADALAADIGGVYSVSRYNAATQDLTWRIPGVSGENFPVRVGYPYIVCLDETAPGAWP